jgi:hypothetical protein
VRLTRGVNHGPENGQLHRQSDDGAVRPLEAGGGSSRPCFGRVVDRGSRRPLPRRLEEGRKAYPFSLESVWPVQGAFDGRPGGRGLRPHLAAVRDFQGKRRGPAWERCRPAFPDLPSRRPNRRNPGNRAALQGTGERPFPCLGALGRERDTCRRSRAASPAIHAGKHLNKDQDQLLCRGASTSSRLLLMAQEFSWPRLWQAFKDAWSFTKGIKDMSLKVTAFLALIGFGVGVALKPEMFLPTSTWGRIALAVLFLLMFAVPVRVAYRFRCQLDDFMAVPDSDRSLIRELKTVAGEAVHYRTKLLFTSDVKSYESFERLLDICGKIRHYKAIYSSVCGLVDYLSLWPVMASTMKGDEYEKAEKIAERYYQDVIVACDGILKPSIDPAPSTASEQSPPSLLESSESKNASK